MAERPILRLLLLAVMGLALASRLALGAALPIATSGDHANAADPIAKLQATMIMCQTGHGHERPPPPREPRGPLVNDLLLFDQADNAHAVASDPVVVLPLALHWSAVAFLAAHAAAHPPLWRAVSPARGPPPAS